VSGTAYRSNSGRDINVTGSGGRWYGAMFAGRQPRVISRSGRPQRFVRVLRQEAVGSDGFRGGLGFTIVRRNRKAQSDNHGVQQSQRARGGSVQATCRSRPGRRSHRRAATYQVARRRTIPADATGNIRIAGQKVTIDPGLDDARAHDQQESKSRGSSRPPSRARRSMPSAMCATTHRVVTGSSVRTAS